VIYDIALASYLSHSHIHYRWTGTEAGVVVLWKLWWRVQ